MKDVIYPGFMMDEIKLYDPLRAGLMISMKSYLELVDSRAERFHLLLNAGFIEGIYE